MNYTNGQNAVPGDDAALNETLLLEAYQPYLLTRARSFWNSHHKICAGVELDDLVQAAAVGLLRAIRRYDQTRGVKLSTYAAPFIIGEMHACIADAPPLALFDDERRPPDPPVEDSDRSLAAFAILEPLTARERRVIVMVDIERYKQTEVAAHLHVSKAAINQTLLRARKKLCDQVKREAA